MLDMIGGLDNPTSGKVIVNRQDLSHMTDEENYHFQAQNIGFVFNSIIWFDVNVVGKYFSP